MRTGSDRVKLFSFCIINPRRFIKGLIVQVLFGLSDLLLCKPKNMFPTWSAASHVKQKVRLNMA